MCLSLRKKQSGFTLIELVMVIVIAGILAAVAVGHFDNDFFTQRSYFDETMGAARFAQKLAIASHCDVQMTLDPSGGANPPGYRLNQRATSCTSGAFTLPVADLAENTSHFARPAPATVPLASVRRNDGTALAAFYFDPLGRAHDAAGALVDAKVTVGNDSFYVDGETGFAYVP